MIGIQSKMLEEIEAEVKRWSQLGMVPLRDVRRIRGKLSWIAGVVPRAKWVVNALYSTMASVQKDEAEGLEDKRAALREDTRPKKGLIPFKRLKNPIDWLLKLLQRKDILLFRADPFVEKKIQYGLVTDASPWGLGGMLIRVTMDGRSFEIVDAFEAEFKPEDAKLLNVTHGEASSQGVVETLAVLRGLYKWAAIFKKEPTHSVEKRLNGGSGCDKKNRQCVTTAELLGGRDFPYAGTSQGSESGGAAPQRGRQQRDRLVKSDARQRGEASVLGRSENLQTCTMPYVQGVVFALAAGG